MKRLNDIRWELEHIQRDESMRLYRLARRAAAHGCSSALVEDIRNEGRKIASMNCEDLLNPFMFWKFAFGGMR